MGSVLERSGRPAEAAAAYRAYAQAGARTLRTRRRSPTAPLGSRRRGGSHDRSLCPSRSAAPGLPASAAAQGLGDAAARERAKRASRRPEKKADGEGLHERRPQRGPAARRRRPRPRPASAPEAAAAPGSARSPTASTVEDPDAQASLSRRRPRAQARVEQLEARIQELSAKLNPMSGSLHLRRHGQQQRERGGPGAGGAEPGRGRARRGAAGPGAAEPGPPGLHAGARLRRLVDPTDAPGPSVADILIVEDKESLRTMLRKTLESRGYAVDEAADAYEARRRLSAFRYLVVLTDLRLPAGSGFDVLQAAREADPETPVVVMTAFGTVEEAVRAMKEGAADFLTKPVDTDHLLLLLDRAIDKRRMVTELVILKEEYQRRFGLPRVLGEDPALKEAMLALQRAAATDATVLLLGESGTGKELMSRALHQLSARAKGPFVAINCAAIPENLLENELFGHEKGAFTGATGRKVGKAELAHKGTLFLDEIGDLPLPLQGKILRLVQERQFERVGGLQTLTVDVRVVAATNRDLRELVAEKLFREDLFFRLSVMPIEIPPLRRRRRDVPLLAEAFLQRLAREHGAEGAAPLGRGEARARRALLAGERARAAELPGAGGDPQRRACHRALAPAARPADARRPRPRRRPGPDRRRSPTW